MAILVIDEVPEGLCCVFRSMREQDRRRVVAGFLERVEQLTRARPTPGELERQLDEDREFRERLTLRPITPGLIEVAITGGRR